ncbi:DUF5620 domain-containing protein [Ruminococcus sp. HUN007]|uniref:DUF5620 domain-containing protein n=1 Tax=Ruminococcus sp. HUN007 TaxID=1514668 RepID=UPI0005D2D1E2|nr:DUF5620 domain-containing protein [Ruminococcus sp. HUN007]
MNEDKSKGKLTIYLIVFLILGVLLVALVLFVIGKNGSNDNNEKTAEVTRTTNAEEFTENWDVNSVTKQPETEPPHESPLKMVVSETETEITDIGETLDKNSRKTYKMDLTKFADTGDMIDSFTFYYHSADQVSSLGEVKGGFGISVDNKCEAKTDNIWYQTPEDFSVRADSFGTVTWEIPEEIKDYVTVPKGSLLFGYWWSNVDKIVLDKVVCHKRTVKLIPCDGEKSTAIGKVLKPSEPDNTVAVEIPSVLESYQVPSSVTFKFEGTAPVSELKGRIGVDSGDFRGGICESVGLIVNSEKNETEVTWVLPDVVRINADMSGSFRFTLERCSLPEVTVKEICVEYALAG